MLYQVTVCLLLCTEFISGTIEEPYRLGNAHELDSYEDEIPPDFNEESLALASEDKNQYEDEDTDTSEENDFETDHKRIKRKATDEKEPSSSKDDKGSSKQSSTIKPTQTSGNKNGSSAVTQRPSTTIRPTSLPTKPTVSPSKVTTKKPTVKPVASSTEKARETILEDPKLTIDDKEISNNTIIYSKVNESLKVICKADSENIQWRGPENALSNNPLEVQRIEKNKFALKFKSITLQQEGNYTCKASKKTTTKKKSFKLKVIDPVKIIEFPQNITISEGSNLTLHCMTSGSPKAIVNWSFNETVSNGSAQFIPIVNQTNSRYKLDGDNLLINNITLQEAGKYMCEVKQDIEKGTTDNKTIEVIVQHKPFPIQNLTTFEKAFNSMVEIPCKMISNPTANYTWFRKIDGIYQNISGPSVHSVLKIHLTNSSQYGEYKCQANNSLGYNEQYITLNPKEFLEPVKVEFIKVTDSVVYFKTLPESESYITHYKVQYKKKDDKNWTNRTITLEKISDIKHKLANLTEKTTYILRVRSINEFGISAPSNEIEFTTKELPKPPKIEIKKLTNDTVYFKIIAEKNGTLTKYYVEYKTKDAKKWNKFYFTIPKNGTWHTKFYLGNLAENTTYILRVRSGNEVGISAPSNEIEFTTKELPRPPKIEIKKLSKNSVSFNAIAESNRTLTRYNAEYKTKDAKNWKTSYFTIPKGATWNTKYYLRNLLEKITYILRVRSVNEWGISAPSDEIEFTTLAL